MSFTLIDTTVIRSQSRDPDALVPNGANLTATVRDRIGSCEAGRRPESRGGPIRVIGIDRLVGEYRLALDAFFRGDPEPAKRLYSHGDDVCLNNPFGPPARGWSQVAEAMGRAATNYRDGRAIGFDRVAEYLTDELACIVELERYEAKVGGSGDISTIVLRVTTVLRPEDGSWKIVHRHADPITSARSASSVIER